MGALSLSLSQFAPAALPLAEAGFLLIFLLAAGVTAVASVGFVACIAYQVLRLIVILIMRLLMFPGGARGCSRKARVSAPGHIACLDPVCRTVNPAQARFCRQCGRMLRVSVPRAAA